MIKYNVWFKDICIGSLHINEEGQHKYVVNSAAVEEAEKSHTLVAEAKTERDWGEPIEFFDTCVNATNPEGDYYFTKDNN